MAWTTPRDWVATEVVTAPLMNVHVRDNLNALTTWASYVPTLTNWTLGNGTISGKYIHAGKLVIGKVEYTVGSTDTPSGILTVSLPVTANILATRDDLAGGAHMIDSSASAHHHRLTVASSGGTDMIFVDMSSNRVSNTVPFTWATGDTLNATFMYEAV